MPTNSRDNLGQPGGAIRDLAIEHNKNTIKTLLIQVEDLAAGADIAARAEFSLPVGATIESVVALHKAAGVGVDGGNTAVLTLRNITEAVDIATVALDANPAANGKSTLAVAAANADIAADDVIGIVVTQGAAANLGLMSWQVRYYEADKVADNGAVIAS